MSARRHDVVLLTDASVPELDPDDQILRRELERRAVDVGIARWDDPAFDPAAAPLVLVRSTFDYVFRRDEFLAFAERTARRTRLLNPPGLLRWNAHKRYLDDLAARKVAVVPTVQLSRGERCDLAELARAKRWHALVVKPAVSAAGRDTLLARAGDASELERAQAALDALLSERDALVQEFLPSIHEEGELSLVYFGGTFCHAVRRFPAPGDFRARHRQGAPVRAARPSTGALLFAHHVLEAAPERPLYARVDVLLDARGNPRLGELEVIEPHLFFRFAPHAAARFAQVIVQALEHCAETVGDGA